MGRVYSVTSYGDTTKTTIRNQVKYWYDGWGNVEYEVQKHNGEAEDEWDPTYGTLYWSEYVEYAYDDGSETVYDYDDDDGGGETYGSYYDIDGDYYVAQYVRNDFVYYPKNSGVARQVQYFFDDGSFDYGSIDDLMSRPSGFTTTGDAAGASYEYLGANTVVEENYTSVNIKLDYSANDFEAWDRFGRVVDQIWTRYGSEMDNFSYTYNRAGNILARNNELYSAFDEIYTYDDLDRLTNADRADNFDQSWGLDGQGNFSTFNDDGTPQTRTVDKANQIQSITNTGTNWITPTYDAAGNMTSGPKPDDPTTRVFYTYDAWNRLVGTYEDTDNDAIFEPDTDDTTLAEHVYDGLNRRIMKSEDKENPAAWNRQYYYNLDWQIVDDREWNPSDSSREVEQYIWSPRYVDAPMVCLHDGNADGDLNDIDSTDWRRYYLTDANHNVTTTIRFNQSNSIVFEGIVRNVYTAYGTVERLNENWAGTGVEELFDGPLYAGYFFDTETGLHQVRNRYYDANLSTWLNRDPIGYSGGDTNLYRYVGTNPTNLSDPSGLIPNLKHLDVIIRLLNEEKAVRVLLPDGNEIKMGLRLKYVLPDGKEIIGRNVKFMGCHISTREINIYTKVSAEVIEAVNRKFPGIKVHYNDEGLLELPVRYLHKGKWINVSPAPVVELPGLMAGKYVKNYKNSAWENLKGRMDEATRVSLKKSGLYDWHHQPDGSLILVDRDLHKTFQHTGLNSILREGFGSIILAMIPGYTELSNKDYNGAARAVAIEFTPIGWSGVISGGLCPLYDWLKGQSGVAGESHEKNWKASSADMDTLNNRQNILRGAFGK